MHIRNKLCSENFSNPILCLHNQSDTHRLYLSVPRKYQCISGSLLTPSQTSGQTLMRSRSTEVGEGLPLGKGHIGLTIKDECKPIPVEKRSEENITLHMLRLPNSEFLILINPRQHPHTTPPTLLPPRPPNENLRFSPQRSERCHGHLA